MSQLLQNAAYGTMMILAVMLLRRVLKDRLSPAARLALWGVCLFRLLTPAAPESVLSLWGLVGRLAPAPAELGTQGAPMPAPAVTGAVYVLEPGKPIAPPAPVEPSSVPAAAQAAFPWGTVLTAVWLAVGIAVGLWYAVGWLRARRAVNCAIPVEKGDPKYRARYRFLPPFARLREGPVEGAPLTFGVVRPQVVLSPGLDAGELACVLAHEGVHARRRDNLWHYAMAAALVVHWWNPAVWLMPRLLRRDIELACDRAALKKLGEDRRAEYAQALVTLSTQGEGNGPAFCQSFGRKATEERIRSIMKFKKPTIIGIILTLVLVLGVSIAFASDPKEPDSSEKPDVEPDGFVTVPIYPEPCMDEDCEIASLHCHKDGKVILFKDLDARDLDTATVAFWPNPCEDKDCPVSSPHFHKDGKTVLYSELTDEGKESSAGEYGSEFRCSVFYDGNVVTRVVIPLSVLEEELDFRMKDNSISEAEAELILTQARSIAEDGAIDWTFIEDNGLRHEELPEESTGDTTVSANGYWDKDRQFVKVRFTEIVRDFILPQALMGEVGMAEYSLDDYTVVVPEIDEQGNTRIYDEDGNLAVVGIIRDVYSTLPVCDDPDCPMAKDDARYGEHYHDQDQGGIGVRVGVVAPEQLCTQSDCKASGVHQHDGVRYSACAATCTPRQYAAALDAWVALDAMTRQEADEWLEIFQTCYDHVQAGDTDAFGYDIYDGTRIVPAYYVSDRALAGYPVNSKGETYGSEGLSEVYGSSPDLVLAMGTNGEEGYIRWSDDPGSCVRNPDEAMVYMEWQKTERPAMYIPLYDCEGNVIGRFAHGSNDSYTANREDARPAMDVWLEYLASREQAAAQDTRQVSVQANVTAYPECHVDGCNTMGQHTHNGVTYCNVSVPVSAASGSHHQGSHHGSGHH